MVPHSPFTWWLRRDFRYHAGTFISFVSIVSLSGSPPGLPAFFHTSCIVSYIYSLPLPVSGISKQSTLDLLYLYYSRTKKRDSGIITDEPLGNNLMSLLHWQLFTQNSS